MNKAQQRRLIRKRVVIPGHAAPVVDDAGRFISREAVEQRFGAAMPDISAENARLDLLQQPFSTVGLRALPAARKPLFERAQAVFTGLRTGAAAVRAARAVRILRAQAARESAPAKAHFPFHPFSSSPAAQQAP